MNDRDGLGACQDKTYYQLNRECKRAKAKRYYQEHCEEIKARTKHYYNIHREEINARRKSNIHKEKARIANVVYREKNLESIKKRRKEYYKQHKEEIAIKHKQWRTEFKIRNPEKYLARQKYISDIRRGKIRSDRLMRNYNITADQYNIMLKSQNNRCGICHDKYELGQKRFAIDHDHCTGIVGLLLCSQCNLGKGAFREDPRLLRAAAEYQDWMRDKITAHLEETFPANIRAILEESREKKNIKPIGFQMKEVPNADHNED